MILLQQKKAGYSSIIWDITETEDFFLQQLALSSEEQIEYEQQKGKRRPEWLAARYGLHLLTAAAERIPVCKTPHHKPFLDNQPINCSLTHSVGVSGAMLSELACGCDIQLITEKMSTLAPRFMHPLELDYINTVPKAQRLRELHFFWGAKEALYKAYGLKNLEFKRDLLVKIKQVNHETGSGIGKGMVFKNGQELRFELIFEQVNVPGKGPYSWVIAYQSDK